MPTLFGGIFVYNFINIFVYCRVLFDNKAGSSQSTINNMIKNVLGYNMNNYNIKDNYSQLWNNTYW